MKKLLLISLIVTMVLSSFAAMAAAQDPIEIRVAWWGSQDRHNRTLAAIDLFEERYPHITVEAEFTGWDGYWERIASQAAGGNLPDVFQQDMQYIATYNNRGLLVDMYDFVEAGVFDLSNVDESALFGGIIDGQLIAVNLGSNSLVGIFDPAIYAEAGVREPWPGMTWDEWIEDARAIHEATGLFAAGGFPGGPFHGFRHYLRQRGLTLYKADGTGLAYDDNQLFIDYFSKEIELVNEGVLPGTDVRNEVTSVENELVVLGQAASAWPHSNQIVAMSAVADRPLKMTLLPKDADQVEEGQYLKPSQFFSIASTSSPEHQEAAAMFVDFFTNDVEANTILLAERGVPISREVREGLAPYLTEVQQMMFDYIDLVAANSSPIDPPEPAGHNEVNRLLDDLLDMMMFGAISVENAAQRFMTEANRILAAASR